MADRNIITIGHTAKLNLVIYKNEPILTFKMIDEAHARKSGAAHNIFQKNKVRFVKGKHYHMIKHSDANQISEYGVEVPPRGLTLITKRGYLLLVKSFTDDLAWEVQEQLVDFYFEGKGVDTDEVDTISATQLQSIRNEMTNCTRYLHHRSASFSQTLYRQMKSEFGYTQIEQLPVDLFEEVILWIRKFQPVCHQVYDLSRFVEREFMNRIKDQNFHNMADIPQGIIESYEPSPLLKN